MVAAATTAVLGGAVNAAPLNVYPAGSITFADCCGTTAAATGAPATASPYGSAVTVSDLAGKNVGSLTVTVVLDHPWPDDVDLLLVGPGAKVVLMSDVGGNAGNAIRPDTLTFSDAGPAVGDASQLQSGTYQPTNAASSGTDCDNQHAADSFPSPAPPPPYSTSLSAFNGTPANGTWTLYAVDDCNLGNVPAASISTWSLDITPAIPTNVRIKTFRVVRLKVGAEARWSTGAEAEVAGYNVFRKVGTKRTKVNARIVPAKGTTLGGSYKLRDAKVGKAAATYQLEVVGLDGTKVLGASFLLRAVPKKK